MKLLFWVWKRNDFLMKNIFALVLEYMYIQRGIYLCVTCIYAGILYIFIFPVEDRFTIRSCWYKAEHCGYLFSLWPLLFVRWRYRLSTFEFFNTIFEWGFIFIHWLSSDHDFISHSIIMANSSSVLTDDVFIFLRLFTLTYVPPIRYVIYGEHQVFT